MTTEKKSKRNDSQGKKILWIQPSHFRIGNALHTMSELEIFRQLAKEKYSTQIIAARSKKCAHFRIENSRVNTISIPVKYVPLISSVMYAIILLMFLPVYIVVFKPDFIVEVPDVSILSLIPAILFSKFKKVKFILDVRSIPVETFGFRGFLQNFWFATSILVAKKRFDLITIITSLMKKEICNKFDLNPEKVGVWTSGVSTELFDPKKYVSERGKLKRELGLSGKFVVFYHGVFTATRGLTETIEGMKTLRLTNPDVALFLLGTGSISAILKDLVRKEELQECVMIHDPVDYIEVPKFIDMCDVCIVPLPDNPYWRFQCPIKLLEYLAMEKVVIVTDIPAHRSIIGKEKCGVYIPSVKPTEIARSIAYAYNNRENLRKWGKSGRKIVNKRYTWDKVAKDLERHLL